MNQNHTNYDDYNKKVAPRQLVLPLDYGIVIKETAPVRLLDAVLEELNYTELQHLYSSKGRKSKVPPHILFKIFIFAMSNGIYSTRKIQQQCEENINYMWLLQGYPCPSHMTFQRFFARCTFDIVTNLFAQLIEAISRRDTLSFNEVFIDGTKLEANANKYTFVWKKSIQKQLAKLPDKLAILKDDVYKHCGIDVSAMNDELLYVFLDKEVQNRHITFVHGKGSRKTVWQRLHERAEQLYDKRKEYEMHLEIMGERNSYSKTDHDATFMRMKEDHMRNGQLKPAYNIQLAVHAEYIMGIGVFPNPNDTNTLIPFVKELETLHTQQFNYIVADAGYDSYENLAWLAQHNYLSCIKPRDYEKAKHRAWHADISKARNMEYILTNDAFICANGRKLNYAYTRKKTSKSGFKYESKVYICESCDNCGLRTDCQRYVKNLETAGPKRIETTPKYDALLGDNTARMTSDEGIQLRTNRSIQVEGAFGVIKQDFGFKRFLHRGTGNIRKMLYLLAMGFNIAKLHKRIQAGRVNSPLFPLKQTA